MASADGDSVFLDSLFTVAPIWVSVSGSSLVMYSKTCVKRPLSKRPKIGFQDQLLLNAGQKYWSILQYLRPSLSYYL